jgi:hypothetical protein
MSPPFLISALDGGEWSASNTDRFNAGERAPVPTGYEAGWVPEPDVVQKIKCLSLPGIEPRHCIY